MATAMLGTWSYTSALRLPSRVPRTWLYDGLGRFNEAATALVAGPVIVCTPYRRSILSVLMLVRDDLIRFMTFIARKERRTTRLRGSIRDASTRRGDEAELCLHLLYLLRAESFGHPMVERLQKFSCPCRNDTASPCQVLLGRGCVMSTSPSSESFARQLSGPCNLT